jgi:hypothetical protein
MFSNTKAVQILNPRGSPPPITLLPVAPRLNTLSNKTIYIIDVNFPATETLYTAAREVLSERFPQVNWIVKRKFGSFFDDDPRLWAEIKEKGHGAIIGPGHMGSLIPAVIGWCISLEKIGVPAIPLICDMFPEIAKKAALEKGMPNMRITFIPSNILNVPVSEHRKKFESADSITGKKVFEEIAEQLTSKVTPEERKTGVINRKTPRLLDPDTPEKLQRYIIEKGWTDYYPVVLPAEEKVADMLKGTSHKPDEIVGKMAPNSAQEAWEYTVEQVAVNAVMAGASPEHLPVILSIASTGQTSLFSSTSSQCRMVVVNGPIRKEIRMNSGLGALGPFNEANAVIGRAWTLISKNLGGNGGVPGLTYTGAFGNNLNYNNLCFAENEEGLPPGWKPVHVQKGFKPEESTVSLFAGFGMFPGDGIEAVSHHEGIRNGLRFLKPATQFYRGVSFAPRAIVMATPGAAEILADEGFNSKEALTHWLGNNIFSTPSQPEAKPNAPALEAQIDIIVVGGTDVCQTGSFHYLTTASIDKWR